MFIKTIYGSCSFELVEKFKTAEKAAKGSEGQFVEIKVNDYKIDFTKVRRENDESQTRTPKTEGQGAKKV
jgi:hypothetical protein